MTKRIILFLFVGLLIGSCAIKKEPALTSFKKPEVLYIYPDGTMKFKGRILKDEDVVIYDAGSKGERAGVKLIIPLHPDVYRDSVTVERVEVVVPVVRKKTE